MDKITESIAGRLIVLVAAAAVGSTSLLAADAHAQDVFVEPDELNEDYEPPEGVEGDRPLEIAVAFDYLHVARKGGDIAVAYQISQADWQMLRDENISMWVSMYVPNETTPDLYSYSYHMPLEGRAGVVAFPEWLSTLQAERVALCMLGAKPYDNLGLGRGYACDELVEMPVDRRLQTSGDAVQFELNYYGGMPYYGYFPWRGPFL